MLIAPNSGLFFRLQLEWNSDDDDGSQSAKSAMKTKIVAISLYSFQIFTERGWQNVLNNPLGIIGLDFASCTTHPKKLANLIRKQISPPSGTTLPWVVSSVRPLSAGQILTDGRTLKTLCFLPSPYPA